MNLGFKYRVYPTKEQEVFFAKSFGCCRKVWNLMLADRNNHCEARKYNSHCKIRKGDCI